MQERMERLQTRVNLTTTHFKEKAREGACLALISLGLDFMFF
jgi:hypothetical protein